MPDGRDHSAAVDVTGHDGRLPGHASFEHALSGIEPKPALRISGGVAVAFVAVLD
jgi:hypothetical protein